VCTRPFRAQGPRIEAERIGSKLLVHNYGHGGSGWSLSWGSAAIVVPLALSSGAREIAVVGCGALGLTSAIALQRAGARVTIYARELPPHVRSSRATGSWTPDARVALASALDATFARRWEEMARTSFAEYEHSLGLAGAPVARQRRYLVSELEPEAALAKRFREDPIGFVHLESRIADLSVAPADLYPESSPYTGMFCRQTEIFRFDITAYSEHLLTEFRGRGGEIAQIEFRSLGDVLRVQQSVVVNCTGYGARALLQDTSVIPIRGQIGWLPPQPEAQYSLQWENLNVVPRPDGTVVQLGAGGDGAGWNDDSEEPDPAESRDAIRMLARLQARRCLPPLQGKA